MPGGYLALCAIFVPPLHGSAFSPVPWATCSSRSGAQQQLSPVLVDLGQFALPSRKIIFLTNFSYLQPLHEISSAFLRHCRVDIANEFKKSENESHLMFRGGKKERPSPCDNTLYFLTFQTKLLSCAQQTGNQEARLPDELLLLIFRFLRTDITALCQVSCVCRRYTCTHVPMHAMWSADEADGQRSAFRRH